MPKYLGSRGRKVCALAALAQLAFCLSAHGQLVASPTISGIPVYCVDATGATVYTEILPSGVLNDLAQSTIEPNGARVIRVDHDRFVALPTLIKLFIYGHECGHHMSGDVFAGVVLHENNLNREKTADRIGIRLLRDEMNITASDADVVASYFQNNPPFFPYYLPGPQRAQWIRDCYATKSNDCLVNATASSDHHISTSPAQDKSGDQTVSPQPTFDSAIQKIMEASFTKFAAIWPASNDNYPTATVTIPYDGKQKSCTIYPRTSDSADLRCILETTDTEDDADKIFDTAKTKLSKAASAWTGNAIKPIQPSYVDAISVWEAASSPDLEHRSFPRVMLLLRKIHPDLFSIDVVFQYIK